MGYGYFGRKVRLENSLSEGKAWMEKLLFKLMFYCFNLLMVTLVLPQ